MVSFKTAYDSVQIKLTIGKFSPKRLLRYVVSGSLLQTVLC